MYLSSTSNSKDHHGRVAPFRFAATALLWLSPVLGWWLLVEAAMWRSGESVPLGIVESDMRSDTAEDMVFMRRYFDQGLYRLKRLMIERREPKLLVLGTSRVMQFRYEMFGCNKERFVNAGGMIQHLGDLEEFAAWLPEDKCPEVILLGIDVWWFNPVWIEKETSWKRWSVASKKDDVFDGLAHASVVQHFLRRSVSGEIQTMLECFEPGQCARKTGRYGFMAMSSGVGFRPDGSYDYALPIPATSEEWAFVDREDPPVAERVRKGISGFEKCEAISGAALDQLRRSLEVLREKGVRVICITPPFATPVVEAMQNVQRRWPVWDEFFSQVPGICREEGAVIYAFQTPDDAGLDDRCMIDGMHAMETFQVAALLEMSGDPETAGLLQLDPVSLEKILNDSKTNPWYVDFDAGRDK